AEMPLLLQQRRGNGQVSAIHIVDRHGDKEQKQRRRKAGPSPAIDADAIHGCPAGFSTCPLELGKCHHPEKKKTRPRWSRLLSLGRPKLCRVVVRMVRVMTVMTMVGNGKCGRSSRYQHHNKKSQ